MPLYNSKFSTSTEQAVAEAAAKAQRYAQEALRSSNAAQVYYEKMVGIGVDVSDFARLDGAAFSGPVTFATKPSVNGQQLITLQDIGPSIEYNFDYQTYQELVDAGTAAQKKGTIYFIPRQGSATPDEYDEYMWVPETSSYELIGSTHIDLSGYVTKTEFSAFSQQVNTELSEVSDGVERLASYSFDYCSKGSVYNKTEAYSTFLPRQDAYSTYATLGQFSAVSETAESAFSAASKWSAIQSEGYTFKQYSWSSTLHDDAIGAYVFGSAGDFSTDTSSSVKIRPYDGKGASGTLMVLNRFSFGEEPVNVEWGLNALAPNDDIPGTYGKPGYRYIMQYNTIGDGGDVYKGPAKTILNLLSVDKYTD